jgi:hypothetical protein
MMPKLGFCYIVYILSSAMKSSGYSIKKTKTSNTRFFDPKIQEKQKLIDFFKPFIYSIILFIIFNCPFVFFPDLIKQYFELIIHGYFSIENISNTNYDSLIVYLVKNYVGFGNWIIFSYVLALIIVNLILFLQSSNILNIFVSNIFIILFFDPFIEPPFFVFINPLLLLWCWGGIKNNYQNLVPILLVFTILAITVNFYHQIYQPGKSFVLLLMSITFIGAYKISGRRIKIMPQIDS